MATKPSILIVDHSADGREMLVEYLAFRNFDVMEARHGQEALETARRVQPNVTLIDLSMLTTDGWKTTRQLRADPQTKHLVIIALTAHAFPREQEAARLAGCDAVVPKPYELIAFVDALAEVGSKGVAALDASKLTKAAPVPSKTRIAPAS